MLDPYFHALSKKPEGEHCSVESREAREARNGRLCISKNAKPITVLFVSGVLLNQIGQFLQRQALVDVELLGKLVQEVLRQDRDILSLSESKQRR